MSELDELHRKLKASLGLIGGDDNNGLYQVQEEEKQYEDEELTAFAG